MQIAEQRPDMNIKVAAFTVSEKSSNIYLPMLSYLYYYMVVRYRALKIVKLLKVYIMIFSDRLFFFFRKGTPIYMLHAVLRRHPIQINIKARMICFWLSTVNGKYPNDQNYCTQ